VLGEGDYIMLRSLEIYKNNEGKVFYSIFENDKTSGTTNLCRNYNLQNIFFKTITLNISENYDANILKNDLKSIEDKLCKTVCKGKHKTLEIYAPTSVYEIIKTMYCSSQ
jgi:hypothetical protein